MASLAVRPPSSARAPAAAATAAVTTAAATTAATATRLPLAAVIARLCVGACLLGVGSNAQQATPRQAGPLLDEVMAAYRTGDLSGAWNAFTAFFEHPARNELHINAFAACFYEQRCPQPGALARILGKPRPELAAHIDGFCPRLRSPEVEAALLEAGVSEQVIAQRRKGYERTVRNGFNGTCDEWRREQLYLTLEEQQVADIQPDVLPMAWYEIQPGGFQVAIETTVGTSPLRLGVDTGSSLGKLHRRSPAFPKFPASDMRLEGHSTESMGIVDYVASTPARLASLRVGATQLQPFRLGVIDDDLWVAHPVPQVGHLGMAFLLTQPSVCFAWEEQRLHLGTLGPCAPGVQPRDALLLGSLAVGFTTTASNASTSPSAWTPALGIPTAPRPSPRRRPGVAHSPSAIIRLFQPSAYSTRPSCTSNLSSASRRYSSA